MLSWTGMKKNPTKTCNGTCYSAIYYSWTNKDLKQAEETRSQLVMYEQRLGCWNRRVPVNWETEKNEKKRKETERKKNEKKTRRKVTQRNEKKRNAKKRKQNSEKRNEIKEKEKKRKNVKKRNEIKITEARR